MAMPEVEPAGADGLLVRASLVGDGEAFARLFELHAGRVRGSVRGRFPGVDAEEIVQEAFVRAWSRLPQLRCPELFGPWVRAIAHAAALDAQRRLRRQTPLRDVDADAADHRPAPCDDEAVTVRAAVDGLPQPQRTAVRLFYFDGLRPEEIARRLGVPRSTVHGRLQTGRAALRRQLASAQSRRLTGDTAWSIAAAVQAIRRRSFTHEFEPRERVVALFTGIPAEVEVVAVQGGQVRVQGTAWGLGDEAASAAAIRQDSAPDAWRTGPHAGLVFRGTTRGKTAGRPEAITESTQEAWARVTRQVEAAAGEGDASAHRMRHLLSQPVHRLSVVSPTAAAAWLDAPEGGQEEDVLREAFVPNSTGGAGWHGPALRCAIRLEVPAGTRLAVVALSPLAGPVSASGLRGDLVCIGGGDVSVDGHDGVLLAWDAPLGEVRSLRGELIGRHFTYGAGNWEGSAGRRPPAGESVVTDVDGRVDMRIGRTQLRLTRVRGEARVENRFGDTTLRTDGADLCGEVRSISGTVTLEAPPESRPALAATTAAGFVAFEGDAEGDWGLTCSNDPTLLGVHAQGDPRLRLHSEAGSVRLTRSAP